MAAPVVDVSRMRRHAGRRIATAPVAGLSKWLLRCNNVTRDKTMTLPETHYTRAGDAEIAYSTVGDGPVDLVWAYGLMTHLELKWEEPSVAAMLRRLAEFSRLILFDRRGSGLSSRGDRYLAPTLEERVEDVVAVLDAVGSARASFFGVSEGCALAVLFASMHPRRTDRIILYGGTPRIVKDAEHPWGLAEVPELTAAYAPVFGGWGTLAGAEAHVRLIAPSMLHDAAYVSWFARQQRHAVSRDAVIQFMATACEYDVDDILPTVRVPTLVLHRVGDTLVPARIARRAASRIPGAHLVELPGTDHLPYIDDADAVVEAIRAFLAGDADRRPDDRQLVTLLATDAAGEEPVRLVHRHVERLGGTHVAGPGGVPLARFGTATRAIRCGLGLVDAARLVGTDLRVGIHTGECEVRTGTVAGPAARVPGSLLRIAAPGEVLVSGTVRDVVPGSGITFTDERRRSLPGVTGDHTVLTVLDPSTPPDEGAVTGDSAGGPVFKRSGEFWTVGFDGHTVTLRDSKGMRDLCTLLARPGRERHVLDLWAIAPVGASPTPREVTGVHVTGTREEVVDAEARDRYRRRLARLGEEAAEAAGRGDPDVVERAREEREWLVAQLAEAYGVGGRTRRVPDEVERARKAVRRRMADALSRIEAQHPALGRHLRNSVHTGVYCSYAPDREVRWHTDCPT